MSEENVELAKRFNAAVMRGDIDAAVGLIAEDVVATELAGPLDSPDRPLWLREQAWP